MVNVYVVTADGYNWDYGSAIYLLGVFTTREKAEEIASQYNHTDITEVEIGKVYPLEDDEDGEFSSNQNFLGGYVE